MNLLLDLWGVRVLHIRSATDEKVRHIANPDGWEPKVFKRKPEAPALHETLQKPTIFEVTPTERWPLGWRPASTTGELKTLVPVYNLKGNFSSITVLLCPQCKHVLCGLGKGIPVVCLECCFSSHEHGVEEGEMTVKRFSYLHYLLDLGNHNTSLQLLFNRTLRGWTRKCSVAGLYIKVGGGM